MGVVTDIVDALATYPALSLLTDGRIYANRLPDNTAGILPCITYELIAGASLQTASGKIACTMPRFRFSIWATDAAQGESCEVPLKDALLGLWGDYEVTFLDCLGDTDPTTQLWWRRYDVRFVANGY